MLVSLEGHVQSVGWADIGDSQQTNTLGATLSKQKITFYEEKLLVNYKPLLLMKYTHILCVFTHYTQICWAFTSLKLKQR